MSSATRATVTIRRSAVSAAALAAGCFALVVMEADDLATTLALARQSGAGPAIERLPVAAFLWRRDGVAGLVGLKLAVCALVLFGLPLVYRLTRRSDCPRWARPLPWLVLGFGLAFNAALVLLASAQIAALPGWFGR